ncbi:Molybdopterin-guanine dinucleotide biosynthesis adapter protein [Burkholderiales bacterium]|nr:MAG: molybdopterin-guanine dinucleotide biosynthesis protein B [Burkholderiales bacterium]CAG0996974.1 Molybdopterin-guanine dinucleotide biosynthesis adapter protein [Burkholderiales bacterium]
MAPGPQRVFGFAGYSGSGKTTLIEQLIPRIIAEGYRVSLIKHAHHDFEIDYPGKDTYRHRQAGCQEVVISSDRRWALIAELRGAPQLGLEGILARLSPCDLVLVEGFKFDPIPKLEIHRPALGKPLIYPNDPYIGAVASDVPLDCPLPVYDLRDTAALTAWVLASVGLDPH